MLKTLVALIGALGLACVAYWAFAAGPLRAPEDALQDFYEAKDRAEDQLMDPLILNGRRVVPLVLDAVQQRDMDKRRYAIGFLGNGRYGEAIPTLEAILHDDSERDLFRGDALEAIWQMDPDQGLNWARQYQNREDYLGRIAMEILNGSDLVGGRRSYLEALLHVHH
jgi:hypothetical protein